MAGKWTQDEMERNFLTPDLVDAFAEIAAIEPDERARVDEATFQHYFLPQLKEGNVKEWCMAVGSPFMSADLFDRTGKVVFTVPPISSPLTSDPTPEGGYSIAEIAADASLRSEVSPVLGESYLAEHLARKVGELQLASDLAEDWKAVYARYGMFDGEVKGTAATSAVEESLEVVDMEDL